MLDLHDTRPSHEPIANGAYILRGFALDIVKALLAEVEQIETAAAFRRLETPGGFRMSVAMTNCGSVGWVSDRRGYRYTTHDPLSGQPWPPMPGGFSALAESAGRAAGFEGFKPDACLVNRYVPGARLTLHQETKARDVLARRSFPFLWDFPPFSYSAATPGKTNIAAYPCSMAMSSSGAELHDFITTPYYP